MTTVFTILFDGVAYGMLLFVLACGLAVTLGLMNFVNLAHGAFAMTGGYICAVLVNNQGWPFFAALPGWKLLQCVPNISRNPDDCVPAMPSAHVICCSSRPSSLPQAAADPNTPAVPVMCQPVS